MAKRSRSRVWIDHKTQGALAFRVMLHWAVFVFVVGVLTLAMQYIATPLVPLNQQLHNMWRNQGPFLIVMLVLLPVFVYDTVRFSNRFAGPIVRLRRAMQEIGQGKPIEKLEFRGNDFWRGLAEDFNKLVERGYFNGKTGAKESTPETSTAATPQRPVESDLQEVS